MFAEPWTADLANDILKSARAELKSEEGMLNLDMIRIFTKEVDLMDVNDMMQALLAQVLAMLKTPPVD